MIFHNVLIPSRYNVFFSSLEILALVIWRYPLVFTRNFTLSSALVQLYLIRYNNFLGFFQGQGSPSKYPWSRLRPSPSWSPVYPAVLLFGRRALLFGIEGSLALYCPLYPPVSAGVCAFES